MSYKKIRNLHKKIMKNKLKIHNEIMQDVFTKAFSSEALQEYQAAMAPYDKFMKMFFDKEIPDDKFVKKLMEEEGLYLEDLNLNLGQTVAFDKSIRGIEQNEKT